MTRGARLNPAWSDALADFDAAQTGAGAAARARATRLRRMGEELAGDPWDVTPADIHGWIDGLEAGQEAARKYRHAARSFYRWAVAAGHITDNPVTQPPTSTYTLDAQWSDALAQFTKAQHGAGLAPETVRIRVDHVRRLARDTGLQPWHVTAADYAAWIASLSVANAARAKIRGSLRAFYRWAHLRGRIDTDPTAEPSRRAATPPVPAAWDAELRPFRSWLRTAGHSEVTVALRLRQIRQFARDHASLSPWAVTIDDIIEWFAGKRWNSETRRSNRSALRIFYRWATETGRTDDDPTARLPAIRMSQPSPRPANDDDYEAALRRANASDRLALRLAAELGMRCAEVACVHSRDVTRADDGWTLLVHGKGSKQRVLPIDEGLAQRLRQLDGYAFPGEHDGHISPRWLSVRISRLLPAGVAMHALRHRFATKAYNVDRDVYSVQQLLGHASPATTQRYVRVDDRAKRRLVEAVGSVARSAAW